MKSEHLYIVLIADIEILTCLILFKSFNIPYNFPSILNTNYELTISLLIIFILEAL